MHLLLRNDVEKTVVAIVTFVFLWQSRDVLYPLSRKWSKKLSIIDKYCLYDAHTYTRRVRRQKSEVLGTRIDQQAETMMCAFQVEARIICKLGHQEGKDHHKVTFEIVSRAALHESQTPICTIAAKGNCHWYPVLG